MSCGHSARSHVRCRESLRFIRERVQSLNVAPERPRPGHLYACSLSQSGYAGRDHLFIVGLEEGRVFSSSTEDAVLLDVERAAISSDLRLSTDRIDEAVYAVLTRFAASTASATFSYSCRDTREFRETYASWLMLQAFRLQRGDATLSYHEMKAALGEPKSAVPEDRQTRSPRADGGCAASSAQEMKESKSWAQHSQVLRTGARRRAGGSLPSSLSSMDTCPTQDRCSILVRPKPSSR